MTNTNTSEVLPRPLGRYELLHEIAAGGMATVYLARVRGVAGFERIVAIKCCHAHLRREQEFADMFLDEARLAARIHHPNVVATLDVGETDEGALFLVMDMIDGFALSRVQKSLQHERAAIPVPIALRIMADALAGLHAAHELHDASDKPLNLVHRDISPQNILVGADGVTRITDFGVAKAEARLSVTREGHLKGKLSYMAPEQIALKPSITRQADLYAAGVVFWEMLTGQRLFDGGSDVETLNLVLRGSVRPPSEVAAGIGADLDAVIARALERDASKRFATALEFAEAIENGAVRPASPRAVGAFMMEILADGFRKRAELLRRCAEMSPLPIERPAAKSLPEREALSGDAPLIRYTTDRTLPHGPRVRRRFGPVSSALALVASVLVVTALSVAFATHRSQRAMHPLVVRPSAVVPAATRVEPPVTLQPAAIASASMTDPIVPTPAGVSETGTRAIPPEPTPEASHRHHHHANPPTAAESRRAPVRFMPHSI